MRSKHHKIPEGYIPDEHDDRDYVFGGISPLSKTILMQDGQWMGVLPKDERQNVGFETYSCVSQTVDNILEMLEAVQVKRMPNWSPRFLAKVSGTTIGGNSPRNVLNAVRKHGMVKDKDYPMSDSFRTYYKPIPRHIFNKAEGFLQEHDFGYETVETDISAIKDALRMSPLGISVPGWFEEDGLYVTPDGVPHNHMTTLVGYKDGEYWIVRDTYEPFQKHLAWDFKFDVVKRGSLDIYKRSWLDKFFDRYLWI